MGEVPPEIQVCRNPLMDLWYNKTMNVRMRRGQAMLEYVLSLAGLLVVVGILWGLVAVAFRHAERTENLVTSDCP